MENKLTKINFSTAVLSLGNGINIFGKGINLDLCTADAAGELCFSTGMTGYQEVITDPSYSKQIIVFAASHIGSTGINLLDYESKNIRACGIVINKLELFTSNYKKIMSFYDFILEEKIPVIFDIDTRSLIYLIRDSKVPIKGSLINLDGVSAKQLICEKNVSFARNTKSLSGLNLISPAFDKDSYNSTSNENNLSKANKPNIALLDGGVKNSVVHAVPKEKYKVSVFSIYSSFEEILSVNPRGIIISNGAGDPRECSNETIVLINRLKSLDIPILGICLGSQLLALSYGMELYQMNTGHHGINHPILELSTNKIYISSHNHEFAIREDDNQEVFEKTFISLFDNTIEGFKIKDKDIYGYQFHPESGPGPNETICFIERFLNRVDDYAKA